MEGKASPRVWHVRGIDQNRGARRNDSLICARTFDHGQRREHEDLGIKPGRPRRCVSQVQPHHVIELDAASAGNLPQSRNPGFDFHYPTTVPRLVSGQLIWNWRTRTDERHLSFENVQELRQFIQAGFPQQLPDSGDSRVVRELVYSLAFAGRPFTLPLAGNQLQCMLFVNARIVVCVHRSELQECELATVLPNTLLAKKHWPL